MKAEKRTSGEWRSLIDEMATSGMTQRKWCEVEIPAVE
jgi:hypothetical protein